MSYFHTCPDCGAHLDPGEECLDCKEKNEEDIDHEDDLKKDKHPELQRV
jgi:predicted amidophosphoribosyltransferase